MRIGFQEVILILIVALVVLGPDKMPEYARKLGEALRQFRKFSSEATKDIRESILDPLEEAQRPLKEALEPVTELKKAVRSEAEELRSSITGKAKTASLKSAEQAAMPQTPADAHTAAAAQAAADEQMAAADTDITDTVSVRAREIPAKAQQDPAGDPEVPLSDNIEPVTTLSAPSGADAPTTKEADT